MAEIIDDTKSFTIVLKAAAATTVETVSLTWVRDNYDADRSRRITSSELYTASSDWSTGKINDAQQSAVEKAYRDGTLLPAYTAYTPSTTAAKGIIVSPSYPTSGVHGATVSISCRVKNTGKTAGVFLVELSGGVKLVRTRQFAVYAGVTSPSQSMSVQLPSSGASIAYTLKCIRKT